MYYFEVCKKTGQGKVRPRSNAGQEGVGEGSERKLALDYKILQAQAAANDVN